jgi:hypothetical protein
MPFLIQLASLLIAAAIFVVGSSFDASAGKKCITIGGKSICIESGKNNNNDNPANEDTSGNNANPDQGDADKNDADTNGNATDNATAASKPFDCSKANATRATSSSTSRTNTARAASPAKASAPLTGQMVRRRIAAQKAPPSARDSAAPSTADLG